MQFHIGRNQTRELCQAKILDDQGVDTRIGDQAQLPFRRLELSGEHQRVHRDKTFHAMTMQVIHQLRQVIFAKVVGTQPRIESWQAKVNCIGTGHHRRPRAIPVARRRQKLGSLIMRRFAVHAPIEPASRQMTSRRRQA